MKKADQDLIKNMNMATVVEKIRSTEPVSRASLSKMTGLSRSTCSILVDQLLAEGLVCETGKDQSSGGRKAILLRMNYEGGRAIGLKLMQNRIAGALVDLGGKILETRTLSIEEDCGGNELFTGLLSLVEDLISTEEKIGGARIFGIGVGIGGKIDFDNGILLKSSVLDVVDFPVGKLLHEKTGIPVFLENDVNAFTLGEKFFGEGRGIDNFLCVSLGSGIGAGVIIEDSLYRGKHHLACEFGHMKIAGGNDAARCKCGKNGCLEAYASDSAIEKYYASRTGTAETIETVTRLAGEGNGAALEAFSRAGRYLGEGLSTLLNLFDPETVIIGGEGVVYYKYMKEEVRKALDENVVYGLSEEIGIKEVNYDDNLWVRGVATLVAREVFKRNI